MNIAYSCERLPAGEVVERLFLAQLLTRESLLRALEGAITGHQTPVVQTGWRGPTLRTLPCEWLPARPGE